MRKNLKTVFFSELIKPLKEAVFLKAFVNQAFFEPQPKANTRKVKSSFLQKDQDQPKAKKDKKRKKKNPQKTAGKKQNLKEEESRQ